MCRVLFGAMLTIACSTPTAGINVVVTYDPTAWNDTFLFDHITVIATGGGKKAVACVLPDQAPTRVIAAAGDASDPCADAFQGFTSKPVWTIGSVPRTINFDFPADVVVTVSATASLGASTAGTSDSATLTTTTNFPSATLTLAPTTPTLANCSFTLVDGPPTGDLLPIGLDPCGYEACSATPTTNDSYASSAAIKCVGSRATVRTLAADDCIASIYTSGIPKMSEPEFPNAIAVSRIYLISTQNGELYLTGHFARCAGAVDGGCSYTTDCVAPTLKIAVGAYEDKGILGNRVGDVAEYSLGCLPPTPSSLAMRVVQMADAGAPDGGLLDFVYAIAAIEQPPITDPSACDFIIDDFAAAPNAGDGGL